MILKETTTYSPNDNEEALLTVDRDSDTPRVKTNCNLDEINVKRIELMLEYLNTLNT